MYTPMAEKRATPAARFIRRPAQQSNAARDTGLGFPLRLGRPAGLSLDIRRRPAPPVTGEEAAGVEVPGERAGAARAA